MDFDRLSKLENSSTLAVCATGTSCATELDRSVMCSIRPEKQSHELSRKDLVSICAQALAGALLGVAFPPPLAVFCCALVHAA